ncbi:multidrug efflux transporter AcrB transmembrane domain-containing protein [Neolentinus lepideus HHB14362 ss-1]|uniref:Multidrug efflux transporter AcrB transmembrane domain-containing protein n=1 Tax=Neolentinus lepideus HHB14362 ss-1 TaxID=1314782 RepID=A0A165N833_9AGAM|nr:multidrug efflux transporter AcrB transmembrane domain-containing protein [Neolentinus lepideus HHB14362 ss-1]
MGGQYVVTTAGSGRCAMRGSCGTKGWFGKPLPCPYDGPALDPEDQEARSLLMDVCGPEYAEGPVCCTQDQVETLYDNLKTAEAIISSCPACRNNFRSFYCTFTCSPDQGSFLNVTETQKSRTGETAVKSVDFFVGQRFAEGFFDSCKSVQFGASNGYAMDFIGGGAKDYKAFLKFMGDEKDLGSPFQINYPAQVQDKFTALNPVPRNCTDNDLGSRCTCIDCPDICSTLPYVPPPGSESTCHVGVLSCLSFILILAYCLAVAGFFFGYLLELTIRRRREKKYESLVLGADGASEANHPLSPRSRNRGLVGASSLAQYVDGEESTGVASSEESRHHLGRGASLLDPMDTVQPRQYRLNTVLRRSFYRLGLICSTSPWLTFSLVFLAVGLLNLGWKKFQVETEPVRLWVAPDSESKLQKEYFDEHFGPFYRPQQIFVTSAPMAADSSNLFALPEKPPVLSWSHLKYWSKVERGIRSLRSPSGYTLDDVCFAPSGSGGACVVQSALAWFGEDILDYDEDTWEEHLLSCVNSPVDCLPDYQQPLKPEFVLGGVPENTQGKKDYLGAEALVVTFVVSDSLDAEIQERAMEWERTLREYLLDVTPRALEEAGLVLSFSTGVSLKEEINKSTNMDVKIVVLSYLAMFFYVSLALGNDASVREDDDVLSSLLLWVRNLPKLFKGNRLTSSTMSIDSRETPHIFPRLPRKLFVGSKFTLGLFGIALVILSVSTSVGFFSLVGVKVTLIIAEVIPFLVLAVGVDNVFILVHELDRQNLLHGPNASATHATFQPSSDEYITTPMSSTQPHNHQSAFSSSHDDNVDAASMPVYLSAEERVARALAKMGPSILLSTVTETVAFALGALVPMPAVKNFALYAAGSVLLNALLQVTVFVSAMVLDLRRVEANRVDCFPCVKLHARIALPDAPPASGGLGGIARFIRRRYAAFLLKPVVKGVVLLTFSGFLIASVISIQHIELGLDQRLALPSESYLIPYFNDLDAYLDVGPPVYFVSRDVDVNHRRGQQALCGRFTTCDEFSMVNVLEAERNRPESSFISEPSASWIDDFLRWLDPAQEDCCRVMKRDSSRFCSEFDSPARCQPCLAEKTPAWNITMEGLPEGEEFTSYLRQWLISPTNQECPLAGKASFGTALSLSDDGQQVVASHFRTFHKPLKSQSDFINSFAAARRIADDLSERTGTKVFPYSLHYVFFDQYARIVAITQEILGLGLGSVLIVTALLLGSWRTGTIVTGVVALTVVTVMGVMGVWGISLNAISLVNLVISLGIAVEFCAHVARAFMSAGTGLPADHPAGQKERDERMWTALVDVGPSVLSGITFTKLIGMAVLGLTRSKLLEIYYFRMWLTLIISGALHGLVLLPVVLSLAGGPGYPQQEADEEWMSSAMRNDYEYAPFLADDDSIRSD